MIDVNRRVLPGFGLSLGYTILYMSLLVMVPIAAGVFRATHLSLAEFWQAVSSSRAVAAYTATASARGWKRHSGSGSVNPVTTSSHSTGRPEARRSAWKARSAASRSAGASGRSSTGTAGLGGVASREAVSVAVVMVWSMAVGYG